jgi:hypothetical protein
LLRCRGFPHHKKRTSKGSAMSTRRPRQITSPLSHPIAYPPQATKTF